MSTSEDKSVFHVLPKEVLYYILTFLEAKDLLVLACVSKLFQQTTGNLHTVFLVAVYVFFMKLEEEEMCVAFSGMGLFRLHKHVFLCLEDEQLWQTLCRCVSDPRVNKLNGDITSWKKNYHKYCVEQVR